MSIYKSIMGDLRREGCAAAVLNGKCYSFQSECYGVDVYCNDEFCFTATHCAELKDLILDEMGE